MLERTLTILDGWTVEVAGSFGTEYAWAAVETSTGVGCISGPFPSLQECVGSWNSFCESIRGIAGNDPETEGAGNDPETEGVCHLPELTYEQRNAMNSMDMTPILGTLEERLEVVMRAAINFMRRARKAEAENASLSERLEERTLQHRVQLDNAVRLEAENAKLEQLLRNQTERLSRECGLLQAENAKLRDRIDKADSHLYSIVEIGGSDQGVIYLSCEGTCHTEDGCRVYDHDNFSELGDALIELHNLLKGGEP
jgi:hypothetical protein